MCTMFPEKCQPKEEKGNKFPQPFKKSAAKVNFLDKVVALCKKHLEKSRSMKEKKGKSRKTCSWKIIIKKILSASKTFRDRRSQCVGFKANGFLYSVLLTLVLLVWWCPSLSLADEARAVLVDSVSRSHQEAVPPDTDGHEAASSDDGPVVAPYHPGESHDVNDQQTTEAPHRFPLLKMDYSKAEPFAIVLWVLIAALAKICFHVTPKISFICPESCLLIVVGIIIGLLLFYAGLTNVGPLTPNVFFLYMLPPIVLDAGYYMPNRQFFDNLATILMFAVVGTVLNAMTVGVSLWAVGLTGLYSVEMPLLDTLLFSSIACAVDPIAVLAVFEEIHVNEVLYILVFGESLLNDAVTVVLYHMFEGYAEMGPENIITVDYLAGVASFFVVAIGGTVVGIIWGLLAAFVSRFTHHVRVIEPLFVFVMSYLSYVSAELFHFSGILSLTFCGITMKNYVEENISYKSHVTVKYAMKMLASSSETIIFLFLGVSTVNDNHEWNTWFVVMTIIFCTLYRTIGVIVLTALANRFRLHRINKVEQFILAYGGLRGAVAFALALIVSDRVIPTKNMMITTIIALIFFTVFIQGMTIGPLVRILNVPTSNKVKFSMNERIHTRAMDHLMAGIEDIVGQTMGNYHLRDKFKYYNNKYLRPILTRNQASAEPKIFETYSKLNLADAMNLVKQNGSLVPVMGNENSGMSLSSLFRTYTQANLDKSTTLNSENNGHFPKTGFPRNGSSHLNVDIGELEYSPSRKDLDDAELHHILSDAMFHPPRRHRSASRNPTFNERNEQPEFRHQMRMQTRHVMSDQNHHRRRSTQYRNNQLKDSNSHNGYQGTASSPASSGSTQNELRAGNTRTTPTLKLSAPDELPSSNWGSPLPMTTETGATLKEPISSYASSMEKLACSSNHEDEGIIFVARENASLPLQSRNRDEEGHVEVAHDTPLQEAKTLTETTLPWKRKDNTAENSVRKQHEFPAWVNNREYTAYVSPSNTLLQRLGESSTRKAPLAVFEVFNDLTRLESNNNGAEEKDAVIERAGATVLNAEPDENISANDKSDYSVEVQVETKKPKSDTKDVVIDLKSDTTYSGDQTNDDACRWQATRL